MMSMNWLPGSAELLTDELKAVRRGPGVHHPQVEKRVGPALRAVCGVDPGDPHSVVKSKTIDRLRRAADALPAELAETALVALGIPPEVTDLPRLQDRVAWLADRMKRDVRTARRRVDDACARLADALSTAAAVRAGRRWPGGWHVQSSQAVTLLDGDHPMVVERRVIVADREGLDQITLGWTLPVDGTHGDLDVRVLYGGVLAGAQHPTATRIQTALELPSALRIGERHEYAVLIQLPPDRLMQHHYAYTPYTACDFFDLRVRFDRKSLPARIWRVAEAFHRDLDERHVVGEPLAADRCGEVHIQFDDLIPGFGYGIQWA